MVIVARPGGPAPVITHVIDNGPSADGDTARAVLSIKPGHDVGYLTKAVAGGREGYYTGAVDAGEPPGLWFGAGAEKLGLTGEVDADLMEAVYTHLLDPRDPATQSRSTWGEAPPLAAGHRPTETPRRSTTSCWRRTRRGPGAPGASCWRRPSARRGRLCRSSTSTFSAPKCVTVLGVAFERAANDAAAAGDHEAAAAWRRTPRPSRTRCSPAPARRSTTCRTHAGYSRLGTTAAAPGRWIDAHEFVVAQFLQHDSRDRDPQLHVHQAILNRVLCSDGVWRTLDSRAIHTLRGAAARSPSGSWRPT